MDTKAKKSRLIGGLLLAIVVVILLCLVVYSSRTDTNGGITGGVQVQESIKTYTVKYLVSGLGAGLTSLTYTNEQGGTAQQQARLPWEYTMTVEEGAFLYISVQNGSDLEHSSVACQIFVDGKVVRTTKSFGAYVIATCSGRL